MKHDRACDIICVHSRLNHERSIRLEAAGIASLGGVNRGIADVNFVPHAISYLRPSREVAFVSPVSACLVEE